MLFQKHSKSTTMVRCVIVDDESAAIQIIENYISQVPYLTCAASFLNPVEAINYVHNNQIDLIFLDINMPNLSGFGFLDLLKEKPMVILTTAYSEYALDGYKYDVLDYLTKPIPFEDFMRATQKAEQRLSMAGATIAKPDESEDYIIVKSDHRGKFNKVRFSNLIYIESLKNYVAIHTTEGEKIVTLLSMRDLEEKLPSDRFMRVHKTYIISLDQIKYIDGGEIVLLSSPDRIPLGNTYRDVFFQALSGKIM
jgi:DNA-binding LytR/AlgR family response regulator